MLENNLNTIDHLLELGFSLAIARQMMETMNNCMATTVVPQVTMAPPAMPAPETKQYYALINDNVTGPLNESELITLAKAQVLTADTMVWGTGLPGWSRARTVPEVNKCIVLSGNNI